MDRTVLVIGDTHLPFTKKHYLEFCIETYKKFKCTHVVHIGDLVDNHAISYHDHDPDGYSHKQEMEEADKELKKWFKAFPKVKMCLGNHDILVARQAMTHGISKRAIRAFEDIWNLPQGWEVDTHFIIDNVLYMHGNKRSGKYAHINEIARQHCSVVMGHLHSNSGVGFRASKRNRFYGMAVGCGVDERAYSMAYATEYPDRFLIGCSVVSNNGKYPQWIPMEL